MRNESSGYFQIYRWVTSAPFFQRRGRGIIDNPQTIAEQLKSAEAKLKIAEEKLAVVDLFRKAVYETGEWEFKGHKIKVERGDVVTAQSALAQQWGWKIKGGWDAKRVARFLKDLESEGWIKTKPVFKSHTIISILIYVPATESAQDNPPDLPNSVPKNRDAKKPVKSKTLGKRNNKVAKESAPKEPKNLPISNKKNKENKVNNDDLTIRDNSCSKVKKDKIFDLQDRVVNFLVETYSSEVGITLFIDKSNDYEMVGKLIQAADADFNKVEKIVKEFFEDKWVIEKSAYSLGSLCSSKNLNRFALKVKQTQEADFRKDRVIAIRLRQGKSSMGFTFN